MKIPDVNVLVALARADHGAHAAARQWSVSQDDAMSVPGFVATAFVRVLTNRSAFAAPSTAQEAFGFLDALRAQPTYLAWVDKPNLDDVFRDLVIRSNVVGRSVSDAYIAAMALSYGATLVTFDHGFRRYEGVDLEMLRAG